MSTFMAKPEFMHRHRGQKRSARSPFLPPQNAQRQAYARVHASRRLRRLCQRGQGRPHRQKARPEDLLPSFPATSAASSSKYRTLMAADKTREGRGAGRQRHAQEQDGRRQLRVRQASSPSAELYPMLSKARRKRLFSCGLFSYCSQRQTCNLAPQAPCALRQSASPRRV